VDERRGEVPRRQTQITRNSLIDQLQRERNSRVIALIHRQHSRSIFGVPVSTSINIEDSGVASYDRLVLMRRNRAARIEPTPGGDKTSSR
jgi:Serine dehydrogenase proteinase